MDVKWMDVPALVAAIRCRDVSPVEVMDQTLSRIEALQPRLNAFITVCADQALAAARAAEARVLRGEPLGPLHGVPFSAKDVIPTAGVRTTMGSFIHEHNVPARDAVAVARLKRAGAILVGKTTTPEFGHKPFTDAPLFGITRNPWDTSRTCGGSSGGAAVAVATGQGHIALGTDGGGSIRIPASCCGVVGIKPTLGRVPNPDGPDLFATLAYTGPMGRTVADVRAALQALEGGDPRDPYAQGSVAPGISPLRSLRGLRLAWLPYAGNKHIDPDVLEKTEAVVRHLEREGAQVELVQLDCASYEDSLLTFVQSKMRLAVDSHEATFGERLTPSLRESARLGLKRSGADYQRALRRRTELTHRIHDLFERFDFLLSPTVSRPAPLATDDETSPITVAGQVAGMVRGAWYPYTFPFNFSGHPALSLPCGLSRENLPIGLQIAARWHADFQLLDLAELVEPMHPFSRPPSFN